MTCVICERTDHTTVWVTVPNYDKHLCHECWSGLMPPPAEGTGMSAYVKAITEVRREMA